jgi:hypothetical protein
MEDLREQIRQRLTECFRTLPPEKRANLEWHRQHGTPVLTGDSADQYVIDGVG